MKYRDIPTFSDIKTACLTDKTDREIIESYRGALQNLAEHALKSFRPTIQKLPEINETGYKDFFAVSIIEQMHTLLLSLTKKEYGLREENVELKTAQESLFKMVIESYAKKGCKIPINVLVVVADKLIKYYDSMRGESIPHRYRYGHESYHGTISQRQTTRAGEILNDYMEVFLDHKDAQSALTLAKLTINRYAQSNAFNEGSVSFTYEDHDHTGYSCPSSFSIANPYPQRMPFLEKTFKLFLAKAPKDTQIQLIESLAFLPTSAISDAMKVAKLMINPPAVIETPQKPKSFLARFGITRGGNTPSVEETKTLRG